MDNNIRHFSVGIKTVAIVLVLAILATLIPTRIFIYAESPVYPESFNEPELSEPELQDEEFFPNDTNTVDALFEDSSLRTPISKTLRQNDGTYKLGTYNFEVHFPTSEGYVEYDNTLIHKDGSYSPTRSDALILFSDRKPEYSISFGGTDMSFTLLNENQNEPVIEICELPKADYSTKASQLFSIPTAKSRIDYKNVLDGVMFSYLIYGKNIKENIVLETVPEETEFSFSISTEANILIDDEGSILIGESVIPHAFMADSAGALSDAVSYVLIENEEGFILSIIPDREWLEDEKRVYPVIIDPTLHEDSPSTSVLKDAYVRQGYPTYNSGYDSLLHVGNNATDSGMLKLRTYIQFQNLPTLPQASRILNASISLQQTNSNAWYSYSPSSVDYLIITAKRVTSGWSDTTITWNNQPLFDDIIVDYSAATTATAGLYLVFDITSCMQDWYKNSLENYGIVLQTSAESSNGHVGFISVNDTSFSQTDPIYDITYYDTKGLDGRWSYITQDVGTAGTLYVNLYNGQPVLTGPSMNTQDALLPYSVYPVYNGYLAGKQFEPDSSNINAPITADFNAAVGRGFKLSCWESVTGISDFDETYYCLNDADGTELYFRYYEDCGAFLSEDGFDMKLTIGVSYDSPYIVTDSSGNVKSFDGNGRIRCICDESGNKKSFNYNLSGQLESISFLSASMDWNHDNPDTELYFSYNTAGGIKKITNAKDSSIYMEFFYSSTYNGTVSQSNTAFLRKIKYSSGDYAEYEYTSDGKLYRIRQGKNTTAGTYSEITYSSGNVSAVSEYSSSGSLGGKYSISYDSKKTTVRTSGQDDIFNNSDDLLNVFLFDNYGKAVTEYCTDITGNINYGASSAEYIENNLTTNPKSNNSLTKTASRGQFFRSLITNGNLEHSYCWSVINENPYAAVSYSSAEALYGSASACINGSSSICTGIIRQSVLISEPGTYTLSAYIKSNMTMGFQYSGFINGAYISLDGEMSEIVSGITDSNIRNGWQKVSVTKAISSSGTYNVDLNLRNMYNSVYFDGVSLIKNDVSETSFNYFSNQWIGYESLSEPEEGITRLSCLPGDSAYGYTIAQINRPASDTAFVISGWSKGSGVPDKDVTEYPSSAAPYDTANRFWGAKCVIYYTDNSFETQEVFRFNPGLPEQWQYASGIVIPSHQNQSTLVTNIYFYIWYKNNANYALFKDFSITETSAACFEYDENTRQLITAKYGSESTDFTYSDTTGNIITDLSSSSGSTREYTYYSNTHRIKTITDEQGVKSTYTYNTDGLPTITKVTPSSGNLIMTTGKTYDAYGNLIYANDNLGNTTIYCYNNDRGLLNYVTNANNRRTQYIYDLAGKTTEIFTDIDRDGVHDSGEAGVSYTYNTHNYLTEIYNGATTYHFAYDGFGNVVSVTIGSNSTPLVSYTYANNNGKLLTTTYADGTYISNTYDEIDRIKAVSYNGTVAYTITYDGEGNVESYTDCSTGRVYRYEYDALGREIRFIVSQNGTVLYSAEKTYDANGNVTGYSYNIPGVNSRSSTNTFDQYNNLTQTSAAGGDTISYTYDGFGRVITKTTGNYKECYEYKTSGNNTSTLLSKITYKYNNTTYKTVSYTYDAEGNVLTEDDGTTYRSYTYDSLNQLATELYYEKSTLIGKHRYYFYSKSGNVTYIEFDYNNGNYSNSTSSGHSYGNNTDWKELLTSFRGTPITYDDNGNPLSYYNGQSYTFTWQKGRQLTGTVTNNTQISYSYDVTGKRISKNIDGTVHNYTYDGSLLLCDKWSNKYVEYFYDAEGNPYALKFFNGSSSTKYYFVRNAAGDILELRTGSGTLAAKYIYDTWGKLLSIKDSSGNEITSSTNIAIINALRYRGYFYDTETKFYYLESRYYDPQTQRFLNSDRIEVLGVGGDILSYNGFAYCENNPVNRADHDGNFWHILAGAVFGAIGGAVSSIVSQVVSGQEINWKAVGISAASGAISGAITAACPCMAPLAAGIVQGTLSAATYAITEKVAYGRDPSLGETLKVGLISGVTAGVTQYVGQELGLIQCFIAGTIVAAKDGPKKIEDIQPGDYVWATDPETGETDLREVKQLFHNETDEWIHIMVNDEEIVCTPNHPFWVPMKGWTKACHLRAGDRLQMLNGEYVVVEQIQHELLEHPEATYNFEVEGLHTYFVGNSGVLVHNECSAVDKMSPKEANQIKADIMSGKDVTFRSKGDAVTFIKTKFSDFPEEVAQHRSAQGWHFDIHEIDGVIKEHINIYSKSGGFRTHIFWE